MILQLLLATIAATTPAPAMRAAPVAPAPPGPMLFTPRGRLACRAEFGTASLVQRVRICHGASEWRLIDARRRARRRAGQRP